MSDPRFIPPLLTFPDEERSPLSIRAKALVFVDPQRNAHGLTSCGPDRRVPHSALAISIF